MRSLGTSTASAVAGVILAQMTTSFGPVPVPTQDGFRTVLAVGAGAALLAFAVAAFVPGQRAVAVPVGRTEEKVAVGG
ncbi:hypothetical protein [Streptomyces sp. B93]|uniref:hypothetical protein n=1 Tax=Streptomyces sp. B93 TaxID=2824875 RepID=UPI001FFD86C2|nr:hypothetical protein [Streptomyces sp. B93]